MGALFIRAKPREMFINNEKGIYITVDIDYGITSKNKHKCNDMHESLRHSLN